MVGEVIELRPRGFSESEDSYGLVLEMPEDPVDACECGMLSQLLESQSSGSCNVHARNVWMAVKLANGRRFNVEQTSEGWVCVSVETV